MLPFFKRLLALVSTFGLLHSCATVTAPQYQVSKSNNEELVTNIKTKVGTGVFSRVEDPDNKNAITLRSVTLVSPHGSGFNEYLREAVKRELMLAGVHDESSSKKVEGTLLKNDLDASSINTGTGVIEAEFKVIDKGSQVFRKIYRQDHTWESSFMGIEAVHKAIAQYQILVEKLINRVFIDRDFIESVNR